MAKYVDGFVLVVAEKKLKEYKKMATLGAKLWMKHGALDYKECVSDDIRPKGMGDFVPFFPKMTNLKKGDVHANVMLMPGDVIIIPESTF